MNRNAILLRSAVEALRVARWAERRAERLSSHSDLLVVGEAVWLLNYARALRRLVKHCEKRRLCFPTETPQLELRLVPQQLELRGVL